MVVWYAKLVPKICPTLSFTSCIFLLALQPLWALAAFQSPDALDLFTIDRTP
jgi:hypothetical protein